MTAFPPLRLPGALALLLAVAFSLPAQAARPMITDDARVVDAKTCQVESWAKKNTGSGELWAIPSCNITGNLELALGGAQLRAGGEGQWQDSLVQAKTLFKTLSPNGWAVGLAGGVLRHHLTGTQDPYAYVPASFSFQDDRFVAHTNLGWLRDGATGKNRLTWGLGSETQLLPRGYLVAETFGQDQGKPYVQLGWRYWVVQDRVQIDTTVGQRAGQSDSRWVSIGLRLLSPVWLP